MKPVLFLLALAAVPAAADPRDAVIKLINIEREAAGCPPLVVNAKLRDAAQAHSDAMAQDDFFSHVDRDGMKPAQRVTATGYRWLMTGENISAGYASPEATVRGWMNSPGHRSNILTCGYTETGVGYVYDPNDGGDTTYRHYWTQVFGRPMSGQ